MSSILDGSEFRIHSEALTGCPPLKSTDPTELGDLTGFSGYRFTRSREGRNPSAVCHPSVNKPDANMTWACANVDVLPRLGASSPPSKGKYMLPAKKQ